MTRRWSQTPPRTHAHAHDNVTLQNFYDKLDNNCTQVGGFVKGKIDSPWLRLTYDYNISEVGLCYNLIMPTICYFDGIKFQMFYDEHGPPHFHVVFGEEMATIGIDAIAIIEGHLTRPIRAKVFEWAAIHQAELRANWELARGHRPLFRIAPLD